jgi:hypothetical protein
VHALVSAAGTPLVENDPAIDAVYTWHGVPAPELEQKLREERYDAVLILQFQTELAAMLRRCGIRRRYGPYRDGRAGCCESRRGAGRSRVRQRTDYIDLARRPHDAGPTLDPVIHLAASAGGRRRCAQRAQARDPGSCAASGRFRARLGTGALRGRCGEPARPGWRVF